MSRSLLLQMSGVFSQTAHRRKSVCRPLVAVMLACCCRTGMAADALERMQLPRLKAVHETVQQLTADRQAVRRTSSFEDVRALLHVHSFLSHDSNGQPDDIRRAARQVGARVVMFTNHPADDYDYIRDGHRGLQDGVLFIPGAEETGLLAFPQRSVERPPEASPQDKVDAVLATSGQAFLCHLEERLDWELQGLTGTEIYNIHADFKDEPALLKAVTNPLTLMTVVAPAVRQYPQETFAALQDYPALYLKRWDELNPQHRLTGVSASDAHQNNGVRASVRKDGRLQIDDALGNEVAVLDPAKTPLLAPLLLGRQPGDVVFELQLDPYDRSFRHVSTHLMLPPDSLTEAAVRQTLEAGRAYVAFDWICDPTGFVFQAEHNGTIYEMGEDAPLKNGLTLHAEAPLSAVFKLIRNGQEIDHQRRRTFEYQVTQPGIYRVEVWVNFPDEPRLWILSNPIYVP